MESTRDTTVSGRHKPDNKISRAFGVAWCEKAPLKLG
jgi:hypothetical protein